LAQGRPLCLEEREEISRGIAAGDSGRQIAGRLGRHYSVVNREIMRNGGRSAYRASDAHQNAKASAQRPKEQKLEHNPLLLAEVNKGLHQK
jgi:IS30 family transposase